MGLIKNRHLLIFLFLAILIVIPIRTNANVLNTSSSDIVTKYYEINNVDFNWTSVNLLVQTNRTFNVEFISTERFYLWDFNVEKDGKTILFLPRLDSQEKNTEGLFRFSREIASDTDSFFNISYGINNVRENISPFWYPFDNYYLINRLIKFYPSESHIARYNFPVTDINVNIKSRASAEVVCDGGKIQIPVDAQENIHWVSMYSRQTTELGTDSRNNLYGVRVRLLTPPYSNCTLQAPLGVHDATFKRTFFPAQFLFWLIFLYFSFLTCYYSVYKNERFWDGLKHVYIGAAVPLMFAEFTVSLLPPSRPLLFTLFDSLILLPLLFLVSHFYWRQYRKKYSAIWWYFKKRNFE